MIVFLNADIYEPSGFNDDNGNVFSNDSCSRSVNNVFNFDKVVTDTMLDSDIGCSVFGSDNSPFVLNGDIGQCSRNDKVINRCNVFNKDNPSDFTDDNVIASYLNSEPNCFPVGMSRGAPKHGSICAGETLLIDS